MGGITPVASISTVPNDSSASDCTAESKSAYIDEVSRMRRDDNIDSVIMGCTEITMLIGQRDFDIPVFDTTRIHAEAAVEFALV